MSIFKKLFGFEKKENTNTRTFSNFDRGLNTGYLMDFQLANDAYLAKNRTKAFELINSAIRKSDISDWQHYAFRANIYEEEKKFADAITDYNKAIEYSNSELSVYQIYHQIGYCYLMLENNKKAEDFYTASLEIKKKHPNNNLFPDQVGMMGGVLLGVSFEKIYNNRGNARKNLGNLNEAFEDCKKAIEFNPSYSNPYLLAGQIQQLAGNIDEAIRLIYQSINLGNPNGKRVLEAIYELEPELKQSKSNLNPEILLKRSMQACDSGDYKTAISLGEELINIHNLPTGFYALGLVYTVMENYHLAKQNCLEAFRYFPQVADNLNRLGVSYCCLGQISEGLNYFRKGAELGDANCNENYHYWKARL